MVSLVTTGLSLVPEAEFHFLGMFQAAIGFSGLLVVAAAEFHIQRFELSSESTSAELFLILFGLVFTYYVASVFAAHSEPMTAWLILGGWLLIGVVAPSALAAFSKVEKYLLGGLAAFLCLGAILLSVLSLWLWPMFYYEYLKPENKLEATPYFMGIVGFTFWVLLLGASRSIKNVVQQRVPADGPASRACG